MKTTFPRSQKHSEHLVKLGFTQAIGWLSQHHLYAIGMGIGIGMVLWLLKPVFTFLVASASIVYRLDLLNDQFEEKGWSRDLGVAITTGLVGLLLTFGFLSFIPVILEQFPCVGIGFCILAATNLVNNNFVVNRDTFGIFTLFGISHTIEGNNLTPERSETFLEHSD